VALLVGSDIAYLQVAKVRLHHPAAGEGEQTVEPITAIGVNVVKQDHDHSE
jgi:hypothetical protein